MRDDRNLEYAGFWIRMGAALIDTVLICLVAFPALVGVYGTEYFDSDALITGSWNFLITWVLPAIIITIFWGYYSATPGKIVTKLKIVDAETGKKPSTEQFVARYFGYYISMIPLLLGVIWIAFDKQKQGWHDKLSGTIVVRPANSDIKAIKFNHVINDNLIEPGNKNER